MLDQDKRLPKAIIVDIDGTLAIRGERSPFDWHRVKEDYLHDTIAKIVRSYPGKILMVSGRDSICYDETYSWLLDNEIDFHRLFMRAE